MRLCRVWEAVTRFIDPFGAAEFVVDGVAYREMVGNEMMRAAFYATEQGENIIRVKLVMMVSALNLEHENANSFLTMHGLQKRVFAN